MVDVRINHVRLRDPQRDLCDATPARREARNASRRRRGKLHSSLERRRRDPKKFNFKDAESDHVVRRVVRRNLFHVLPFDGIDLNSIGDGHDDVLHDLGALGHGAAHFFGVG